jgi:hypothetical protein
VVELHLPSKQHFEERRVEECRLQWLQLFLEVGGESARGVLELEQVFGGGPLENIPNIEGVDVAKESVVSLIPPVRAHVEPI